MFTYILYNTTGPQILNINLSTKHINFYNPLGFHGRCHYCIVELLAEKAMAVIIKLIHSMFHLLLRQTSSGGLRLQHSPCRSWMQAGFSLELAPLFIMSLLLDLRCGWSIRKELSLS